MKTSSPPWRGLSWAAARPHVTATSRATSRAVRFIGSSVCEPDGVQLLVQETGRRDRPAAHLGAVRNDPVPLQRIDVVHFLVEQAPLERAQVTFPFFRI